MSDYEDEMDVDGPAPSKDITFSSDNTAKGKRSAANLPVEAEDSLPWVEKYRPVSLTDVSGHQDILATINKFVDSNRLPHLLLYGPPGTGKTSTILALSRRIYGEHNMRQMVLELNASDDRGIDVVREQIKTFASTKQIFTMGASSRPGGMASYKLIILDEADAMTNTAQMALRRIMEKYTANTRFCVIANYTHKLSPALLSRCTRFRFSPLKEADIRVLVDKVIMEENVKITGEATDALVKLSKGDMRRALNVLQACHASSTPLQPKDGPKVEEKDIVRDTITIQTIYNCIAAPPPDAIEKIAQTLLTTTDVTSCLSTINTLKVANGLALADIITSLSEILTSMDVKPEAMIRWLDGLAEIEYRMAGGGSVASELPSSTACRSSQPSSDLHILMRECNRTSDQNMDRALAAPEILHIVCSSLGIQDVRRFRPCCKLWSAIGACYAFEKIVFYLHKDDLDFLREISLNEDAARNVHEIVYIADILETRKKTFQEYCHYYTLTINTGTTDVPINQASDDDVGTEVPECRRVMEKGLLRDFIASLKALKTIVVQFDSHSKRHGYPAALHDVIYPRHCWEHLYHLSLSNIVCERQDLVAVLKKHKTSLMILELQDIRLYSTSWLVLLPQIRKTLRLDDALICGELYGRNEYTGQDEKFDLEPPDCAIDDLRVAVTNYLCDGGRCPLTDRDNVLSEEYIPHD
ncbi:putative Replication factor C subunit 3 [Seiridium unicorne]|uniref:Replication factor C subunit 3 n=1 Tax=Seiridium unicorne TaxID=138068 RepID=A0ABR2UPP1_9PEZI